MLNLLKLRGIGPAHQIEWNLAQRLNVVTGDNGLGKTFLLECAWWALTGVWSGYPAYPRSDATKTAPSITFRIGNGKQSHSGQTITYNWDRLEWPIPTMRNTFAGLSIFAQIDESFTILDPSKQFLSGDKRSDEGNQDALIHFSRSQVWDGVEERQGGRTRVLCNGLIRDWVTWQNAADQTRFQEFCAALKSLSPHPTEEPLIPGQPTRLPGDARDIPTLKFSYGEVPILLCSAGIQRIVALAYLLIWAWNEHVVTSRLMRKSPTRNIALLIDEMESHLHPFWQRAIVPALMDVVQSLASEVQTQMIISTHSPLVLASLESRFDPMVDSLFHLYQENGQVQLDDVPFVKRGRVDLWLISDLFGLKQPRSKVAEETIEEAKRLQQLGLVPEEEVKKVSDKLVKVLAPDDEFWPRWTYFAEQRGVHL
jgi:hypothetical protein